LVDQTEAIIVVKLCDGKVEFDLFFALGVHLHRVQQRLGESSNDTLFIVRNNILEELVNELDFEIRKIETCVVV